MQDKLRKQLQQTTNYCQTLQKDFQNNLLVIEERQAEVEGLLQQINQLQQQHQQLTQNLSQIQLQTDDQIRMVQGECVQKMEDKEREMEEMIVMIEGKLRKEVQTVNNRLNGEIRRLRNQLGERQQAHKRVLHDNSKQQQTIKDQKGQLVDLEAKLQLVAEEKNSYSHKMVLHLQELDSVKNCQQEWEDTLKGKIKQAQLQRQRVQEELSEVKLTFRDKLKRQKQDFAKKLVQLADQKESQMRQATSNLKQLRYKLQKTTIESRELGIQLQKVREQKSKGDNLLDKYKENQMKSNFQKNQKEFQMMQKMFDQNARDLKLQIQTLTEEKKGLKEQLDETNARRESVQKSLERVKIEYTNKNKEVDELRKESRRMKNQMEVRLKEYEAHRGSVPPQSRQMPNSSGKHQWIARSVNIEGDGSDIGASVIDAQGFFDRDQVSMSPKNKQGTFNSFVPNSPNRQGRLMKKIGQLQVENQEYKNLIKSLREDVIRMKEGYEEDKRKETGLWQEKANIYWEKANDKEQQLNEMKNQYRELKSSYNELNADFKVLKESEGKMKQKSSQDVNLKQKLKKVEDERDDMKEQLEQLQKQRDMLEYKASELTAENHSLRQIVDQNIEYQEQPESQEESQYRQTQPYRHYAFNQQMENNSQNSHPRESQIQQRQKIPKKLHDLVREKKSLAVSGKRVLISEKGYDVRMQHVGTESQKQVFERIKSKSKTPPKGIVNYADLRQKERRTSQIETVSQKQAYQRLKSRNVASPQRGPQSGINYLHLRQQQSREE